MPVVKFLACLDLEENLTFTKGSKDKPLSHENDNYYSSMLPIFAASAQAWRLLQKQETNIFRMSEVCGKEQEHVRI